MKENFEIDLISVQKTTIENINFFENYLKPKDRNGYIIVTTTIEYLRKYEMIDEKGNKIGDKNKIEPSKILFIVEKYVDSDNYKEFHKDWKLSSFPLISSMSDMKENY